MTADLDHERAALTRLAAGANFADDVRVLRMALDRLAALSTPPADDVRGLIARFDRLRNSGICSPTTRGLLDDAPALLVRPHGTVTDAEVGMLRELSRRRDAREIRWTGEFFLSREELDLLLRLAEVRPRGTVTDAERAAINGALIEVLPLWTDEIETEYARSALLRAIVPALEAAREARS